MSEPVLCGTCKNPLPVNAPLGLCPLCLLRSGVDADSLSVAHPGEAGVTAYWNEEIAHKSVLDALRASIGDVPRVLLRDTGDEDQRGESGPSPESESSETIGRYPIESSIGKGGMGEVFRGRDTDLGRDLAIKVLLEEYHDDPKITRRFVEEAQIGGQLVHPGIVPVYELGTSDDLRPFFTMKLVKGRTLAALLKERTNPAHDLPRFLGIFEHVCQTMAFAHSRSVIHRDLKPPNIMVGAFGEVQVMDWGLAKVLTRGETANEQRPDPDQAAVSVIRTVRTESDADASRPGSVMGTPAYMAPEQAGGDVESIDERADVFGLGSILCEILTGQPAYTGSSAEAIRLKAMRGETADALRRLDNCGADAELVALARDCLAIDPAERPREAGELARRMTAYSAGVQERLRSTELARAAELARAEEAIATAAAAERARAAEAARAKKAQAAAQAAQGRARAERRARQMTVGLAASVLGIVALGVGGWVWMSTQRIERLAITARHVNDKLDQARGLLGQARAAAPEDLAKWSQAYEAAKQAEALLAAGEGDAVLSDRVATLLTSLSRERKDAVARADQARHDRRLLESLEEIRAHRGDAFDPVNNDPEYAAAFREYGIEVETIPVEDAGRRIAALPRAIAVEVAAALDNWGLDRRSRGQAPDRWHRPIAVARVADPDPWRDRLRGLLLRQNQADREQPPGPVPPEPSAAIHDRSRSSLLWEDRADPEALSGTIDLQSLKMGITSSLVFTLSEVGNQVPLPADGVGMRAPESIQQGVEIPAAGSQPLPPPNAFMGLRREPALADLESLTGATELESLDTHSAYLLAIALRDAGSQEEAIKALRAAQGRYPSDVWINYTLAETLSRQRPTRWDEVVRFYTVVRALRPELSHALGHALAETEFADERLSVFRDLVRLRPSNSRHHYCLGKALTSKGKLDEAIAEYRAAIRLQPDLAEAHDSLGAALRQQEKLAEAVAAHRDAVRLKPDLSEAHTHLGDALRGQGKLDEAITEYRTAILISPHFADARTSLAWYLALPPGRHNRDYDEAAAHARKAVELNPSSGSSYGTLALAEYRRGRWNDSIAASERSMALIKGGDAHNWFLLALALWQQGQRERSRSFFDQAVTWTRKQDPKNAELLQFWREAAKLLGQPGPVQAAAMALAIPDNPFAP